MLRVGPLLAGTLYAPVPSRNFVASLGRIGANPWAELETLLVTLLANVMSASTTAPNVGRPAALPCNTVVVVPRDAKTFMSAVALPTTRALSVRLPVCVTVPAPAGVVHRVPVPVELRSCPGVPTTPVPSLSVPVMLALTIWIVPEKLGDDKGAKPTTAAAAAPKVS